MATTEFDKIVSPEPFLKSVKGIEAMILGVENLSKEIEQLGIQYESTLKKIDISTKKGVQDLVNIQEDLIKQVERKQKLDVLSAKLNTELQKQNEKEVKTKKDQIKQEEKSNKEKEKTKKLTDEEIKEKIKLQKINRQRRKDLEAELILETQSINNKNELKDRIKALRIETDKLDFGDVNLQKFNDEIDALTEQLSDSCDQFIKNKINIGNYKSATEGLTDSFEDQKKKLKILTDAYQDAVAEGDKNTKEAKELRKELKKQEEAIKDVTDATKDQEKASKSLGTATKAIGVGLIIGLLAKLSESFGTSREASLESARALSKFTESVKVLFASLVNAFQGVKTIFTALSQSISGIVTSISDGIQSASLKMELFLAQSRAALQPWSDDAKAAVMAVQKEIDTLNEKQEESAEKNVTFAEGWDQITKSFDGFLNRTDEAIDFQDEFLILQQNTEIAILKQTRALAGLAEKRQILQDMSDDDTVGFIRRELILDKARKAAIGFADLEEQLALTKEKLTIQAIKGELLRSALFSSAQLKEIETGEDLNKVLAQKGVALKVSDDAENAFTEAFVERVEKQTEALSFQRDQDEKNRKTFRDSFEQRLDIIEEFGEKQFALNEKIIESNESTQEERARALNRNKKLEEDLFNESVGLITKQAKLSIDLNSDLTESEKEISKAKLTKAAISGILNESDQQEIFNKIRLLDLGEIEEKRLKESLKIKQDLNEANKESSKSLNESDRENLELQREISLQQDTLDSKQKDKFETLGKEKNELEKKNLEERIDLLEEDSTARLELEKELNDLLLNEQQDAADKKAEEDAKSLAATKKTEEERKKLIEDGLTFLENLSDALFKKKLDRIDDELEASKSLEQKQIDSATAQSELQEEAIDFQRKKQLELEQERARTVKREKTVELGLTYLRLLSSYAQAGDENPVGKATRDVLISKAFIDQLVSAKDGIDDTGTVSNPLDKDGGRIMLLHNNEAVHTKKQTDEQKKMGLFTTEAVQQRLRDSEKHGGVQYIKTEKQDDTHIKELIKETKLVSKSIGKIQADKVDYDVISGIVTREVKKQTGTEKTHKRLR